MEIKNLLENIVEEEITKFVISNSSNSIYRKINGELKNINDTNYQLAKYTEKQVFHENIKFTDLNKILIDLSTEFKQYDIWTKENYYIIKISKRGKLFYSKKKNENITIKLEHNRKKNYLLKEGTNIEPLVDLGVFTKDFKIVNSMYDKYKQINRFIEMINDSIEKLDIKQLRILDFGCGKSYLTFVVYYFLTEVKKIDVEIIGLDLKKDVIEKCNQIAKKYNYDKLKFELGDINGYTPKDKIDMVISLHACDVATDYALYNAVTWNVKMIFSVPCCQHELNGQIKTDKLSGLTKYGLIKERFSALATDAIRGSLLEACGYQTQLLEFIDIAHSPKNILIRAIKTNVSYEKRRRSLEETKKLMEEFNFNPTLYNMLESRLNDNKD